MSKANINLKGPAEIKINTVLAGRTLGDVDVRRATADYQEVARQDSINPFKLVKKRVQFEISFDLAEHTAANLALGFDAASMATLSGSAVQEKALYIKTADGVEYSFAKAVQVNNSGPIYTPGRATRIPLRWWALLGAPGTVPTLGGVNLPAQFNYREETRKRGEITQTFGGLYRQGSAVRDKYLLFDVENMTLAEKNTLQGLHDEDDEQIFQGIHGESHLVFFEEMDPPREEGGLWSTAGSMTITEESGGYS